MRDGGLGRRDRAEVAEEPVTSRLTNRMNDPHAVQISVDGSCYPNEGRKSGYAGVVVYPDDTAEHEVVFQGFKESTINRMELSACNAAMVWVKEQGIGRQYSRELRLLRSCNGSPVAPTARFSCQDERQS